MPQRVPLFADHWSGSVRVTSYRTVCCPCSGFPSPINRIPHFSITRIDAVSSGSVSATTLSTSECPNAQAISDSAASVAYPRRWCAGSRLYPISQTPFCGRPLKPPLPISWRDASDSSRTMYHSAQPTARGSRSSISKYHRCDCSSCSGGGQLAGTAHRRAFAKSAML
jgi:hypothetical protein